ncbi:MULTISPECIES: hypothetical protein [Staphylococcus]|nr:MULTISPECIES: hypothetical protein [Staphylococcus]EHM72604.1 hypothetical protein HMPREF9956_2232 [Staphylococcus epidermidis 14.1.R1.SE]MDU2137005.1 hypothetical protein [Staphylococcus warneri]APT17668.1 hypothetical protein BUM85_12780 [Staphylococcus epidermidis]AYY61596.1 hypothetical protein EGX64_03330 [Staphylococcus epidermidis]EFV88577.1 putative membrane protein [Staphylococcus epidermidis FRI909]
MEKTGKPLKVWTWIFIVLTIVTPLFAIGSIICSIKYKKYDEVKGAKLLQISIIVAVIIFVLNLLTLFGLR